MRKKILYDKNAVKELNGLKEEIQKEFETYIEILADEGRLEFPEARKVAKNLFEIRVIHEGAYRGFYAYAKRDYVVLLHFFGKKTQKTPLKDIKLAQQRFKQYE